RAGIVVISLKLLAQSIRSHLTMPVLFSGDSSGDIPAVVMHYGVFIQNVFDFLIVAFAIFMAIKLINKLNRKKEEPAAAPAPTKEEVLLTEIRDLLKEQNNRS
ncbi:large conductance mechanosensitive channel protein MscL, partial [Escherichia coli]